MNIQIKFKLPKGWKMFFEIVKVEQVSGINSLLENGKHIILWDFDNLCLNKITEILTEIQQIYNLPDIMILTDENRYSYRAMCFKQVDFKELLTILIDTQGLDLDFFRWTARRGKATMRITKKKNRKDINIIGCLYNYNYDESITIPQGLNFETYETPNGGFVCLSR